MFCFLLFPFIDHSSSSETFPLELKASEQVLNDLARQGSYLITKIIF